MNVTQSKRSKQPAPSYQCANPSCGLESGDIGEALPASSLFWSGTAEEDSWAWHCSDCIEDESMERGQSLSAFMAEELGRGFGDLKYLK